MWFQLTALSRETQFVVFAPEMAELRLRPVVISTNEHHKPVLESNPDTAPRPARPTAHPAIHTLRLAKNRNRIAVWC